MSSQLLQAPHVDAHISDTPSISHLDGVCLLATQEQVLEILRPFRQAMNRSEESIQSFGPPVAVIVGLWVGSIVATLVGCNVGSLVGAPVGLLIPDSEQWPFLQTPNGTELHGVPSSNCVA